MLLSTMHEHIRNPILSLELEDINATNGKVSLNMCINTLEQWTEGKFPKA
jgi:hypothetical protein